MKMDTENDKAIVCGLHSKGSWMWLLIDETVTTQDFRLFLFLLSTFIKSNYQYVEERVKFVQENALIHLKNSTKNMAWRYWDFQPYWFHLYSVDFILGIVKRHIRSSEKCKNADFS